MTPYRRNARQDAKTNSEISLVIDKTDYAGGETVRGRVELSVREALPARAVRLELWGLETSVRQSGLGRSMKQQTQDAVWFDEEMTLFGDEVSEVPSLLGELVRGIGDKGASYWGQVLAPGDYKYEFEYTLPEGLPGDYESTAGDIAIRYGLRAYVDIPFRIDMVAEQQLTVYETGRKSSDADAVATSMDKSCIVHRDGNVLVHVGIDRQAYKLGDDIQLTVDVDNQCTHLVDGTVVRLRQVESVSVHGETEQREKMLAEHVFDRAKAAPGEKESHKLVYTIPPELYPTIDQGKLVNVAYQLNVELEVDLALNPIIDVPIRLYEEPGLPGGQSD